MSDTDAVAAVICPECDAPRGRECHTRAGFVMPPHRARTEAMHAAQSGKTPIYPSRNPLDDMPPLDKRKHNVVDRAEAELGLFVSKLIEEHDLTYGEAISILTAVTSRWATRLVRHERETEEAEDAEERAGERD